jgi:hypothetical protein
MAGGATVSDLRKLLHGLADAIADHLEAGSEQARYYDQDTSPLPRETHCRLVRSGAIVGFKRAGRVLVERETMHRYIDAGRVDPTLPHAQDNDAVVAAGLKQLGLRRAG